MAEAKTNRFTKYFALLLDALRSKDPEPLRPAEARAWLRSRIDVPADDLTRQIVNGKQTIFENDVHWARFYLAKAGLITSPKRGLWGLTPEGQSTRLTPEETWEIYVRIRDSNRATGLKDEEDAPPEISADDDDDLGVSYWFVGETDDHIPRFLNEGIWQSGHDETSSDLVRRMKPGDRIAIKGSFVQRRNLPFDVSGERVSVMRIKATGTILEHIDERTVKVIWDPPFQPRDWYFYTYLKTAVEANKDDENGRRLIDFTFRGTAQDYASFLAQPYWSAKYGAKPNSALALPTTGPANMDDVIEIELESNYSVADITKDGCFVTEAEVEDILARWRSKKNLILQGPPGTGKTWLAKRLGFALVGSNDREVTRSRLRVVQFHPSLAYEDFVRGWRPGGDGRLSLVDGILMQAIEAAKSEPDLPFVLVIEEINRGNPAQIFGEMLTLLEDTKRRPSEAIELSYRKAVDERIYIPKNLYVIGTMNIADRSLAIVDLALRRRFAFVNLEPTFGSVWRNWCAKRGLEERIAEVIEDRIAALNREIASAVTLGPQFRIGHSFVTPDVDDFIGDSRGWFLARLETEIGPLLDEYWYDAPEKANEERAKLLRPLI